MGLLTTIFIFYFGCIIGSFLNVVILRLPNDEKLDGRSHCPSCKHVLTAGELVPLFSFLFLGRKCSNCSKKISWRYFIIEFLTGLLFAAAWLFIKPSELPGLLVLLRFFVVISIGIVVFMIDLEHYLIMTDVIITGLVLLLVIYLGLDLSGHTILSFHSYLVSGLLGAIAGAVPLYFIWYVSKWFKGEPGLWMGFGDGTVMLFLGAAAGLNLVAPTLLLAIFLGGFGSIFLLIFKGKKLKSQVPFGTFLTVASIIILFFGPQLVAWYLSLMGL